MEVRCKADMKAVNDPSPSIYRDTLTVDAKALNGNAYVTVWASCGGEKILGPVKVNLDGNRDPRTIPPTGKIYLVGAYTPPQWQRPVGERLPVYIEIIQITVDAVETDVEDVVETTTSKSNWPRTFKKEDIAKAAEAQDWLCPCGQRPPLEIGKMEGGHKIAYSNDGPTTFDNLVAMHKKCNRRQGIRDLHLFVAEFYRELMAQELIDMQRKTERLMMMVL